MWYALKGEYVKDILSNYIFSRNIFGGLSCQKGEKAYRKCLHKFMNWLNNKLLG